MDDLRPILVGLIAAAPGLVALLMRRKAIGAHAAAVAGETTIKQYNLLYDESRRQLTEYREEVTRLREELEQATAREDSLEDRVHRLEHQIRGLGQTPANGT